MGGIDGKRAKACTSAAIIISAVFLCAGCGDDKADTKEKLQIEPIGVAEEVEEHVEAGNERAVAEEKPDADTAGENPTSKETQDTDTAKENAAQKENRNSDTKDTDTEEQEMPAGQTAMYDDVLAQYTDMVRNDFYTDLRESDWEAYENSFGKDIGLEIRTHRKNIFYALYDIDGNGTEELIIAGEEGDVGVSNAAFAPWNYDLYSFDGTKVVSVFPDMEFGYRTNFSLYANGVIGVFYSSSAAETGNDFYKIGSDGVTPELMDSFSVVWQLEGEDPKASYFQKDKEITEEEYKAAMQDYMVPLAAGLEWEEIY